jgi:predicted GIY-YIG superfamily endonuclease
MAVYLLCYERGLLNGRNRHYVGYAAVDVERRIGQHRRGTGSAFAREMKRQGIGFRVAAIWPDLASADEREIKRQKQSARFCPICRPGAARPTPSEKRVAESVHNASQAPVARQQASVSLRTSKEAPVPFSSSDSDLEDLPF